MNAGRRYVLIALSCVYMVNYYDRPLMNLSLETIKREMSLSDTYLGFLTGASFALFYAFLGIPFARWADRGNRVHIAAIGLAVSGAAAGAFLLITTFAHLLLARVGGAAGEATCQPASYSLLGDLYPDNESRTRAMSIFIAGGYVAALLSYFTGGWLVDTLGWRAAMAVSAVPCFILAVVLFATIKDPRQASVQGANEVAADEPHPTLWQIVASLCNVKSLRLISACFILLYTIGLGLGPWYGALLVRKHGLTAAELGIVLGLVIGVGGLIGTLLGGLISKNRFRDAESGQLRALAATITLMFPLYVGFALIPSPQISIASLFVLIVAFTSVFAPTYALIQELVPARGRASTLATIMLFANLIGMGLGPQLVGLMSDAFQRLSVGSSATSLAYAMVVLAGVTLVAALLMLRGAKWVRDDVRRLASG